MQSASGCSQLEKMVKLAEGARRGITRRRSTEGSMFGDARMQLLKPDEQTCMHAKPFTKLRICVPESPNSSPCPAEQCYS